MSLTPDEVQRLFRDASAVLFAILAVSTFFHLLFFMSDSPVYRVWTFLQTLMLGAALLAFRAARRLQIGGLVALGILLGPLTYINATYLNYGNGPLLWVVPPVVFLLYASLFLHARASR